MRIDTVVFVVNALENLYQRQKGEKTPLIPPFLVFLGFWEGKMF
jgi:hypothetical protein